MDVPVYHLDKVVRAREDREDFDGPLDLILSLLSKNKIEIRDLQISLILDQYLEWMEKREKLNLEIASEFVAMAAQLIYIKTRMLLAADEEETQDEMEMLMAALEERERHENYLKIREVIPALEARYQFGRDYIPRAPEKIPADRVYHYVHDKEDLLSAVRRIQQRRNSLVPPSVNRFEGIVGREPYPVADKAKTIMDQLVQFGVSRFRSLFRLSQSRSEVVATFLAVLELCKANRIHVAGTMEDCTVTSTWDQNQGDPDLNIDQY